MNLSKQTWTIILMTLILTLVISGCGAKKTPPPPPPPPPAPKPVTATLTATPSSIESGQSATLSWSTENADEVTLDGVGKVDANGSKSVSPSSSTSYHLTAKGPGGTQDATARVTVTQAAPPPPPPPPPSDDAIFDQSVHDVYFDYDKYDLRAEAQQSLAQAAQVISQHANWIVLIEGNCDERGSIEYNNALGVNRATAAKDALIKAGVNASQLRTVSYGKEKQVCTEANEDCWQKNRHDHFVLQH